MLAQLFPVVQVHLRCLNSMQVRFDLESIQHKTVKGMDRTARLAMLPEYEIFSVDLTEDTIYSAVTESNTK